MKRFISATLALTLLGSTAAVAAPFHRDNRGPSHHSYTQNSNFHRGNHFNAPRGRYVVVNNWNNYHLRRPPHGYHWVRYNNDYLLVALTGGLIADIMMHH